MKNTKERTRLLLIVGLAAAGGYGLFLNSRVEPGPESGAVAAPQMDEDEAEDTLIERFERYRELRLADDWPALYDLADPEERTQVDLRTFLNFYGQGLITTHDLQLNSIELDLARGRATTNATTNAELNVDALPSNFRMQEYEKDDTVVNEPHDIAWVLRDGVWFWCVDETLVRGKTRDGRSIRSLQDGRSGSAARKEESSALHMSKEETPLEGSGDSDDKPIR